MKRYHKVIAGLLLAAGISGMAIAQGAGKPGGCDGMGPMGGQQQGMQGRMKIDPAQRAERHLSMMKGQLKITPEQEPLWNAYAEKMTAQFNDGGKGMHAMRAQASDEKLTAPERMSKMQTLMEEHLATMKGVHESFNRLYAALTPEQKATADQFAARMGQGRGGMKQGGKPGQGPGRMAPPQG